MIMSTIASATASIFVHALLLGTVACIVAVAAEHLLGLLSTRLNSSPARRLAWLGAMLTTAIAPLVSAAISRSTPAGAPPAFGAAEPIASVAMAPELSLWREAVAMLREFMVVPGQYVEG